MSDCRYSEVAPAGWWHKGVVEAGLALDPIVAPRFSIDRATKIATAGSCFAQHIGRALGEAGYTFLVTEPAHPLLSVEDAQRFNFGIFTARTGNIYTARGLLQTVERALDLRTSAEPIWTTPRGRFVDPLRPYLQPDGFGSSEEIAFDRKGHAQAVRTMIETMDVLVFTLGLTETWERIDDSSVLPACPGCGSGTFDPALHRFRNLTVSETIEDLERTVALIAQRNPHAKILLTVSPVPLIATFSGTHVLTATTYSKSVLRVAAEEIKSRHAHVDYLPAYEIITGAPMRGRYFADDLRSVSEDGIRHVMRCFFGAYSTDADRPTPNVESASARPDFMVPEAKAAAQSICDEERLMESYRATTT